MLQKACQALSVTGRQTRTMRLAGLQPPDKESRPSVEAPASKAHPLRLSQVQQTPHVVVVVRFAQGQTCPTMWLYGHLIGAACCMAEPDLATNGSCVITAAPSRHSASWQAGRYVRLAFLHKVQRMQTWLMKWYQQRC